MQIFELYFNPKDSEDSVFDSFCYEPENFYEKKLGSLFISGELKNVLPQNSKLLDNFASFFKKKYYSSSSKRSLELSLKECLKKSNDFFDEIVKKGDVSWLGNLNLAILNLRSHREKYWDLNFTKIGNVKILLLRSGQIIDIGKNLELEEIEPYPLKVFGKVVSGKLAKDDVLLVLTEKAFDFFAQKPKFTQKKVVKTSQSLLEKIARIAPDQAASENKKITPYQFFNKGLNEILKNYQEDLKRISGSCLLIFLGKENLPKKRETFAFRPKIEKLSFSHILKPLTPKIRKFWRPKKQKKTKKPKKQKSSKIKLKLPKLKIPKIHWLPKLNFYAKIKAFLKHKNVILILALIFFLVLGFLIFK